MGSTDSSDGGCSCLMTPPTNGGLAWNQSPGWPFLGASLVAQEVKNRLQCWSPESSPRVGKTPGGGNVATLSLLPRSTC